MAIKMTVCVCVCVSTEYAYELIIYYLPHSVHRATSSVYDNAKLHIAWNNSAFTCFQLH